MSPLSQADKRIFLSKGTNKSSCPRCPHVSKRASIYSPQKKHGPTLNDQTNENVPMSPMSQATDQYITKQGNHSQGEPCAAQEFMAA